MKKYVILDMETLNTREFDHKDDVITALAALRKSKHFIQKVLKWHPVANCYAFMDSYEDSYELSI